MEFGVFSKINGRKTKINVPITAEDIQEAIRNLPTKKAPGMDHLRNEMLRPIQHLLTPLLLSLFRLC
jgi:hypothetical protein